MRNPLYPVTVIWDNPGLHPRHVDANETILVARTFRDGLVPRVGILYFILAARFRAKPPRSVARRR